jgi:putative phosphoesterase
LIVGLISDTHGLLRPEVFAAFQDVEMILHAGDVGGDEILDELAVIAPVRAVAGNTDPPGNPRTPDSIDLVIGGISVHVSHGHELGAPTFARLTAAYDADVVVYGHTHRQRIDREGDRWIVNPGAAGQRRFKLKPAVARMTVTGREVSIELVELDG